MLFHIGVTAIRLTFKEGVFFAQLVLIHVYIKSKNERQLPIVPHRRRLQ